MVALHYSIYGYLLYMVKKISNKQQLQISKKKDQILDNFYNNVSDLSNGIVACRFGNQVDLITDDFQTVRCSVRRTVKSITTGDNVLWHEDAANSEFKGIVEIVKPRTSELHRPDFYDGLKPIAANITRIFIVSSIKPELSTNIIDRYLIACEETKIRPVIVINKIDLLTDNEREVLKSDLKFYNDLGYDTYFVSTVNGDGISELKEAFMDQFSVIVGQSGVGKSSLLNTLIGTNTAYTNSISETSNLGQHTTTSSRLYFLNDSTKIIDSPGVREFGLWHFSADTIARNYREFRIYLGTCKFKDCKHINEIGCSIKEAVEEGKINKVRYENYLKILSSNELVLKKNKTRRANNNKR